VIKLARHSSEYGARNAALLTASHWLGLRAKEIAALKVGDVFSDAGSVRPALRLKPAYTKNERPCEVFVSSPKLISELKRYASAVLLGATKTGRHFSPNGISQLCRKLYHDAGIQHGSSHSGRRTFITRLAEQGVDLKALSIVAGHSSVRTTAIYVETNPNRLARIIELI
jgi:integrase/recombinase XerD